MSPQIIRGLERQLFDEGEKLDEMKKHLSGFSLKDKTKEVLGLYWIGEKICLGNYIGAVWIGKGENRAVLRVDSKFKNPTMDYMAMFAECCADSIVGKKMHDCFDVWSGQELIEISDADDFSFMVVVSFLQELNTLCTHHLRRHFHRQRDNFVGKVKGKILIGENLQHNIGHAERMFCEYQAISDDILENRILRAALEKAARYLSAFQSQKKMHQKVKADLQRWIHSCRTHLQGVSVVHIARRDFGAVRSRGAFAPYRRPLHLAKAVLHHFGFNPHAEREKNIKTPPYCINSSELFERYAEIQLRKKHESIVSSGSSKILGGKPGFDVKASPDFYVPRQEGQSPLIIDAKYKNFKRGIPKRTDLNQVVAYSQHFGVLQEINKDYDNKEDDSGIELHLAYPSLKGMPLPEQNFTESFKSKIYFREIECPVVLPDSKSTGN